MRYRIFDIIKRTSVRVRNAGREILRCVWHVTYTERLKACKLPTLHYRHIRGDMIEMYKILSRKYDIAVTPWVNDFRLQKLRVRYDLRKFGFSNRVINKWNSLPNSVVSTNTTNTFKVRLDKFWHNQDIVYDFRAQLQWTGSRSEVLCEEF